LVRRFAIAVGAMHAARDRDVHVVPTPLLGGFAMYAGLAAALVVASQLPSLNSVFADTNMARGLLLAGGLVVVMGFVDDRWGMGVISKLAGQVAAGVILVWSGAEVTWLPGPHGTTLGLTSDQQIAVTILVVVITINAVNFIDGLDGLAAGIVGIGAAAFFAYYFTLTHRLGLPDQAGPGRPGAGVRRPGRDLSRVPAAQLPPGAHLHGRYRRDADRAAAGLRADLEPGLARSGVAHQLRLRHGGQPVRRDRAPAAAGR